MTSKTSNMTVRFGTVITPTLNLTSDVYTQSTNITTAVTTTTQTGVIITQGATAIANAAHQFTVNNSSVSANSIVIVSISGYSGNGFPSLRAHTGSGSFSVTIQNSHNTDALNAALKISYLIL